MSSFIFDISLIYVYWYHTRWCLCCLTVTRRVPLMTGTAYPSRTHYFTPQNLCCRMFSFRYSVLSTIVCLFVFHFGHFHWLSFDLWLLIGPLISSNYLSLSSLYMIGVTQGSFVTGFIFIFYWCCFVILNCDYLILTFKLLFILNIQMYISILIRSDTIIFQLKKRIFYNDKMF